MATEGDYKREILAKYEAEKNESLREILNPSSKNLKDWSIHLLDSLNSDDEKTYERFYGTELTIKNINDFDNDKFRPLTKFLRRQSELTSPVSIELLAILVGLENRPFLKFIKTEKPKTPQPKIAEEETTAEKTAVTEYETTEEIITITLSEPSAGYGNEENTEKNEIEEAPAEVKVEVATEEIVEEQESATENDDVPDTAESGTGDVEENEKAVLDAEENIEQNSIDVSSATEEVPTDDNLDYEAVIIPQNLLTTHSKNWKRNRIISIAVILILFLFGAYMVVQATFTDEGGCMMWKGDHYETVPCDMQVNVFAGEKIIAADKMLLKYQRKIEETDTVTFFNRDDQARVFYLKDGNDKCEFFTYPGIHPETGKKLKPVTHYMVNKYIRNNK